ncbi:hypothetical protein RF55_11039 [Lasius niger]|uniref:Uncharacterized protein n=1 Tax=Lasius niger TaxID=67767 RepID=A0A0J7KGD6_LASNI|nr:hypothetical protein RF55_11039 [Lasius niger]
MKPANHNPHPFPDPPTSGARGRVEGNRGEKSFAEGGGEGDERGESPSLMIGGEGDLGDSWKGDCEGEGEGEFSNTIKGGEGEFAKVAEKEEGESGPSEMASPHEREEGELGLSERMGFRERERKVLRGRTAVPETRWEKVEECVVIHVVDLIFGIKVGSVSAVVFAVKLYVVDIL